MSIVFVLCIVSSIFASTSLITLNKYIMRVFNFGYPTFLSTFHFALSVLYFKIMIKLKFISPADFFPEFSKWEAAFFNVGSIVLMNYNLKVNSVGFYQISKLCNIPVLVTYKFFFLNQKTVPMSLLALSILLVGLALFTVNDVELSLLGTFVAILAVIFTCVSQTLTQTLQQRFQVSGTQLNALCVAPQTILGFITTVFLEYGGEKGIVNHEFTSFELFLIFMTGVFAIIANLSTYFLIGKAGPVTYQVIGHVKTMLIFVISLIVFPPTQEETRSQQIKKICGLLLSMCGVIIYTYSEMQENNKKKQMVKQIQEQEQEIEQQESLTKNTVFEQTKDENSTN